MQLQPVPRVAPLVTDVTGAGPATVPRPDVAPPQRAALPRLLIRRLGPQDSAALADHFIDLSPRDRRTRFGGNASEATIEQHCETLDLGETVCFAALDPAGNVVGAALGFRYGHGRQFAEVAVSVAAQYRRRGLGTDLVTRVCDAVSASGADAVVFEFDPSNAAIVGLVRQIGGLVVPCAESCTIPLSTRP